MFKKLIIATAILAASANIALANGTPYLGISTGYENDGGYNGLVNNLSAGYGATVDKNQKVYLGGELFTQLGSISLSHNQMNRSTYGYGASFIPGYMLTPCTMLYGRLGVISQRYTHFNAITQTDSQVGVGLQTSLARHWDLRGEYVHTNNGIINNFFSNKSNQANVGVVYKFD